ncbi:helix-turn-helix domain-containing protein [Litorivivens sp.]|uniref:helix-turn-helix domain-containing protein n=1 Tax=Litorivivens sp. TaxID=2020868 RepID=UPI0035666560
MSIGSRIKQARQAAGLSQAELAAAMGITRSACSQWESGQGTAPRRERLEALAAELGVSYQWLTTGRDREAGGGVNETVPAYLTADQLELLHLFKGLTPRQRKSLIAFLRTL